MIWEYIVNLIAFLCEIVGVLLMANAFFKAFPHQIPGMMLSALWRGERAKDGAELKKFVEEVPLSTLQGLSFIALGFVIKFITTLVAITMHLAHSG